MSLVDYNDLFNVLSSEPEIEVLINPFISAWRNEALEQLEGQIARCKDQSGTAIFTAIVLRSKRRRFFIGYK